MVASVYDYKLSSTNAPACVQKPIRWYGEELPVKVWIQIFICLPVRTLLLLSCVSKKWYTLIKDPLFIKEKTRQTQKMMSKNNSQLLLQHEYQIDEEYNCFLFDEESITGTKADQNCLLYHFSGEDWPRFIKIHGPVNGLYCLHNTENRFVIWNPATNEVGFLPSPEECLPYTSRSLQHGFIGFGTDPLDEEDYKVILISVWEDNDSTEEGICCMLYTTRTNTWRLLNGAVPVGLCYFCQSLNNTYLNGSYYWMGQSRGTAFVFDMSKNIESFRNIKIPSDANNSNYDHSGNDSIYAMSGLALHNNQIYLFGVHKNLHGIDIWVMVDESNWSRKASVSGLELGCVIRPLGFWKTENELLFVIIDDFEDISCADSHRCQTVLYNTTTQKAWKFGPRGYHDSFKAFDYCDESLVSLSGGIIKYKGKDRASLMDNIWCFFQQDGVYKAPPKP